MSVNGNPVEAKLCTFTLESTHFILCPTYTHDGASAKFSINSQETDYSVECMNVLCCSNSIDVGLEWNTLLLLLQSMSNHFASYIISSQLVKIFTYWKSSAISWKTLAYSPTTLSEVAIFVWHPGYERKTTISRYCKCSNGDNSALEIIVNIHTESRRDIMDIMSSSVTLRMHLYGTEMFQQKQLTWNK